MGNKGIRKLLYILSYLIIVIVICPFATSVIFSVPFADDYSMAIKVCTDNFATILFSIIGNCNSLYASWGGLWPYFFIEMIFNPLVLAGSFNFLYGVVLLLFFLLFCFSIYLFSSLLIKYIFHCSDRLIINLYIALFMFVSLNILNYTEIFYWFVGSSYMWELTFCLLCMSLTILYFHKSSSYVNFILLCIFGFITCFAYQIATFVGIFYLIEFYIDNKKKKFSFIMIIPLVFMIFGGLISCFAPGNFIRHAVFNSIKDGTGKDIGIGIVDDSVDLSKAMNLDIVDSLKNSVKNVINLNIYFLGSLSIIVMIGLNLILALKFFSLDDVKIVNPFILIIIYFILLLSLCFPIALGYSSGNLPNRVLFHIYTIAIMSLSWITSYFTCWLKIKLQFKHSIHKYSKYIFVLLAFVIVCQALFTNFYSVTNLSNLSSVKIIGDFNNIIEERELTFKFLEKINNSDESDIVIDYKELNDIKRSNTLNHFDLSMDVENYNNNSVASYYHKKSIVVKKN